MDIRKLQRAIVDGLEDVKAQNIAVYNTEHLSSMFERVIIASGSSAMSMAVTGVDWALDISGLPSSAARPKLSAAKTLEYLNKCRSSLPVSPPPDSIVDHPQQPAGPIRTGKFASSRFSC